MKIAVYGAGGVGGYFGGRLALAGADVHLIARGPHLDALCARGLRVRSVRGDFETHVPATDDPAAIGPCDFVLSCVKSFDTEVAAVRLRPLIRGATAVINCWPLPNGYSSLHFDMTHGRRMELEGLHGTLVRLARKHGISVPRCETIYSILRPWAARNEVRVSTAT